MDIPLFLHGREMHSIFELLGTKENDITYSIGWALAQSPQFRQALVRTLFPSHDELRIDTVQLQERSGNTGITDVELTGSDIHVIIEAKRGWSLPGDAQLKLYAPRLRSSGRPHTALVSMSECSSEYAALQLSKQIDGITVQHLPWKDVAALTRVKRGTHAEKRLLKELGVYFERFVKMQNQESNMVYVVSVAQGTPDWSEHSWIDMVEKLGMYIHPAGGKGWPKEPPNYIGFRYHGQLQAVHHIENWKIVTDVGQEMPGVARGEWPPHFIYRLGPPIRPAGTVKTGKVYRNGRVWAMLDLLLTSDTVSDARDKTQARLAAE